MFLTIISHIDMEIVMKIQVPKHRRILPYKFLTLRKSREDIERTRLTPSKQKNLTFEVSSSFC